MNCDLIAHWIGLARRYELFWPKEPMLQFCWMERAKRHASAGAEVAFVFLKIRHLVIIKVIV